MVTLTRRSPTPPLTSPPTPAILNEVPLPLPALTLTSWAGLAAAGALIAGCWRSVKTCLSRVADLFICRIVLKEDATRAMLSYLCREGRQSPIRMRVFGGIKSYVFPQKRVQVVGYEGAVSQPMLIWFGRAPIVVTPCAALPTDTGVLSYQGSGADLEPRYAICWALRGTIDPERFTEHIITGYNALITAQGAAKKSRRFAVLRLSGGHAMAGQVGQGSQSSSTQGQRDGPFYSQSLDEIISQRIRNREVRPLTWRPDELIERSSDIPPFDLYPYAPDQLGVLTEIEAWMKSGDWYRSKGVPHRRGYLLHGPTGGGKSTFVRSVGIRFDLPVYVFDLSSYSNEGFANDWKTVQQNAPAIALIEDLDCVFRGRENLIAATRPMKDALTFDCLLNTISGVGTSDGVLLFMTTNEVRAVDPALGIPVEGEDRSSRPGRLDRTILFGPMERPQRERLASLILADAPSLITPTVDAGEGEMAAQFQERCAQLALREFWAGKA